MDGDSVEIQAQLGTSKVKLICCFKTSDVAPKASNLDVKKQLQGG